ncbi:uncharacterized protein METZ01_LOCUS292600, partial [marine metagenome]
VPEVVSDPDPTEALLPELRLEAG